MERYGYRKARRFGKKDGRSWRRPFWPLRKKAKEPQPALDQTSPAQFETELNEAAESDIRKVSSAWEALDEKLKPKYCRLLTRFRLLREKLPTEREEEKTAKANYDKAAKAFLDLFPSDFNKKWVFFALFIIGIVEFPLNGLVFAIFGQGKFETYLFAAVIGVVIPFAGHLVGHNLRQEERNNTQRLTLIISLVLVLAALMSIGFLRAQYLSALLKSMPVGINISPLWATIIFLSLNLLLFTVASVLSYWGSHPHHTLYKKLKRDLEFAENSLKKEAGEAKAVADQLTEAHHELTETKHRREKKWKVHFQKANELKEFGEYLIATYRKANMEARDMAAVPKPFLIPPLAIEIPENLKELDWDCLDIEEPTKKGTS